MGNHHRVPHRVLVDAEDLKLVELEAAYSRDLRGNKEPKARVRTITGTRGKQLTSLPVQWSSSNWKMRYPSGLPHAKAWGQPFGRDMKPKRGPMPSACSLPPELVSVNVLMI